MSTQAAYYTQLAAAYVRGKLRSFLPFLQQAEQAQWELLDRPLNELDETELETLIQFGLAHELRLHRFKRTMGLLRVQKVLGILKGLQPSQLLDIGSGRGAFLWPLLSTLPALPVTAIDTLDYRVADILAVRDGGISHLDAVHADVTALPFADRSFDVVTMLEVLEHVPDTPQALAEICRVARRFVILSVPSHEDDNPEHIHLFNQHNLQNLLHQQGVARISFDFVLNHLLVVVRIEHA